MSHRDVPELEKLLSQKEYDMEDHTVSILELNVADLKEGSIWIGQNNVKEEEKEEEQEQGNSESEHSNGDDIEGMSLQEKHPIHQESKIKDQTIKSLKDVRREIKKTALRRVQTSKAFQQKQKLEQHKNRKQSKRELHRGQKLEHGRKRAKQIKKKSKHH